jgi:hypothetical protein
MGVESLEFLYKDNSRKSRRNEIPERPLKDSDKPKACCLEDFAAILND